MSEYQEKHTVSRLIGSPPGYVGYEEGGLLTDTVRKNPHAVVLLDEIEKAHPDIYNILLQIMDYATLTDNQGRKADFRNVILIMTSNAGARDVGKNLIGFGDRTLSNSALDEAVERAFTPEFRNRLDAVVHFGNLPMEVIERIVTKALDDFNLQLAEKKVRLVARDSVVKFLAEKGYSREFGAAIYPDWWRTRSSPSSSTRCSSDDLKKRHRRADLVDGQSCSVSSPRRRK
jgi:ATP-dependent Clp protease ATP-binding subunit ClpA